MLRKSVAFLLFAAFLAANVPAQGGFNYPKPRRSDQVDDFHGVKVADPYRWMEDTESAETRDWIAAENKITDAYLQAIPQRAALKARLTELTNYERFGAPSKVADGFYI